MALTTFAPNGLVLTNGNLTGTADYNYPLKANQSKSSGKWYWEIKYNSGSYPMIGVAGISTGAGGTWTGNLGRYYYYNGNKYPGPSAYGSAIDNPSSKIVRSKIVLSNKIPIRRIEIK